ncbi:hypothetical protein BDZ94DRAFT_1258757 [Collybia nuda]|uniref:DUF6593 domain-containing protein n=1 Tax=Collybia nuda TaxID=64659 RepID=A0A9P6CIL3_9AGAR|nr:hypothetical protein BDZ94DRAFT_1258757 [Collybia nuda]
MNLHLSDRSPINATYFNDDGQAIYKVETPIRLGTRTSTITRVIPNDATPNDGDGDEVDMRDRFGFLAQIEHKPFSSSVIKFGGIETEVKHYFRKEGWSWYGRDRVFTGPDGKEYRWLLQSWSSKLVLNDAARTRVAKFRTKSYGIIGKAHPARLEIQPIGEAIMDTILVTFIHIEKTRKDKERASRNASAGGGGGGG